MTNDSTFKSFSSVLDWSKEPFSKSIFMNVRLQRLFFRKQCTAPRATQEYIANHFQLLNVVQWTMSTQIWQAVVHSSVSVTHCSSASNDSTFDEHDENQTRRVNICPQRYCSKCDVYLMRFSAENIIYGCGCIFHTDSPTKWICQLFGYGTSSIEQCV